MGDSAFRTFQTVSRYENALARHGQWLRWVQAIKCPCVDDDTMRTDPHCPVCKGRGRLFQDPDKFVVLDEIVKHDGSGKITPKYTPVVSGSPVVYHQSTLLTLSGSQPADGSYVQLDPPYPELYRRLTMSYEFSPVVTVTDEDSEVYDSASFILRIVAGRFNEKGKSFEGSVKSVSRVYNVTRDETLTVSSFTKEFITLTGMGAWQSGDVLEVDYTYIAPFDFMLTGVTGRIRYEQPYVLPEADAVLVTPYWAQPAPNDLFTAMSQEQIDEVVVNPGTTAGNDEISSHYDLSRLIRVVDKTGTAYTVGPGKNVELYGRNQLKWNVSKPAVNYTVQFTFHPTYTALTNLHTLRNSENKAFVNRVSVKRYEHLHSKVNF